MAVDIRKKKTFCCASADGPYGESLVPDPVDVAALIDICSTRTLGLFISIWADD
jgi:hypothetical protein